VYRVSCILYPVRKASPGESVDKGSRCWEIKVLRLMEVKESFEKLPKTKKRVREYLKEF